MNYPKYGTKVPLNMNAFSIEMSIWSVIMLILFNNINNDDCDFWLVTEEVGGGRFVQIVSVSSVSMHSASIVTFVCIYQTLSMAICTCLP